MNLSMAVLHKKKNSLLGFFKHGFFGEKVWLDSSAICQLKCPLCSTAESKTGVTGKGYLAYEDFKRFVAKHPFIKTIELSNWGEMFLNPDLEKILAHGYANDITFTANNGVNFNKASDAQIEALVKYRVHSMLVSIDGATQQTYKIYRVGGNFERVIKNIKKVNHYKKLYNQKLPVLNWQYIIFGHNEKELPKAKEIAQELGMNFHVKLNGDPNYSPITDVDQAVAESGYKSWNDVLEKTGSIRNHSCYQLWQTPVINWDGKLLGCCRNRFDHFGNVFTEGLGKCTKSEKYRYTKKMVMGKVPPRKDIPCMSCYVFDIMQMKKIYVKPYQNISLKKQIVMRMLDQ